jgi:hypothetical protein
MPAPALTLTRSSITYTNTPAIELRGFRITATITSASEGADWALSVSTQLVDASVVDTNDQSYRATKSKTLPFNEFPTLAAAEAELQSMVDEVYDEIPTPA